MGKKASSDESVKQIDEALALTDGVIYSANPVRQFSEFTNKTTNLDEESGIYLSEEYLNDSELNAGDSVKVKSENGELVAKIVSDNKIAGNIIVIPTFDSKLNSEALFSGYRFASASIEKV